MATILLHTLVFPPDSVSTSYLMGDLSRELCKRGHTVKVLTTVPHYNLTESAIRSQPLRPAVFGLFHTSEFHGARVWHVPMARKREKVGARLFDYLLFHVRSLLIGSLLLGSYDVVLAPSPPLSIGIVAWLLSLCRGACSIYNVQEIYPDFAVHQNLTKSEVAVKAMQVLERTVYRVSSKVVVISDDFGKIVASRGAPITKITTIPNFVDTDLYRPLACDNNFARNHLLNGQFVVLYGGNIGLSQDLESVLYAAERVLDLPVRFLLVGDGVRARWLMNEVNTRRLGSVAFLGYQPREMMPAINACCDIALIPMKRASSRDTFPSKIYTHLACAKPVLASADEDSELASIIRSWKCGRVVAAEDAEALTDAIRRAYAEKEVLAFEGAEGRQHVLAGNSKEAVGSQYDRLIVDLQGSRARAR